MLRKPRLPHQTLMMSEIPGALESHPWVPRAPGSVLKDLCSNKTYSRDSFPQTAHGMLTSLSLRAQDQLSTLPWCLLKTKQRKEWLKMRKKQMLVNQSCLTLGNFMDCSPPGSSVHGIFQAGVLEWVAIPFSRGSFQPRDQTQVSCTPDRFFTVWAMSITSVLCKGYILYNSQSMAFWESKTAGIEKIGSC